MVRESVNLRPPSWVVESNIRGPHNEEVDVAGKASVSPCRAAKKGCMNGGGLPDSHRFPKFAD
jgi:hypothetical protein